MLITRFELLATRINANIAHLLRNILKFERAKAQITSCRDIVGKRTGIFIFQTFHLCICC